jgi:Do/DeqQ family serine protease
MKTKKYFGFILMAIAGGFISLFGYTRFIERPRIAISAEQPYPALLTQLPSNFDSNRVDFTYAAEKSIHAVVHVKTMSMQSRYGEESILDYFFGFRNNQRQQPIAGFGSGVIISSDGYIVTNNHVIENAEEIQVTLNDNRTFEKVKLVGRDPDTDIAVLKIEEKGLPYISYGNSDQLLVGEWVLAVGNPYNLTSTVTAGIVSAKARSLNILNGRDGNNRNYGIESFIQTDAAVNPGNSGGALVNTRGELVGINTAIASPTGSYIGNSFAIPVTIVRKVVGDLIEYGKVQRAMIGITISNIDSELAKEKNIDVQQGVYVSGLEEKGAAKEAGIQEGDIIISINKQPTNTSSQLQEQVSRYRPNDKVEVEILRENKKKQILVTLRNMDGTTKIVTKEEVISVLGAQLADVKASVRANLGIRNGVQVVEIGPGKLRSEGVQKGFIITSINRQNVSTIDDVKQILGGIKGGVYIEGLYPNGVEAYYAFGM